MKNFNNCWEFCAHAFNEIDKVSSTIIKKDLIKLFGNSSDYGGDFKIILRLTYDPYIKFYVARVIEKEFSFARVPIDHSYTMDHFLDDMEKLSERVFTGDAALEWVYSIYKTLPYSFQPYLEKILKKDLKIGIASGLINDVFPELIPEFKLALCERFKKVNHLIGYPKIVEPKIDGIRAIAFYYMSGSPVEIKARSGILFENFSKIESQIELVGERFKRFETMINMLDSPWRDGFVLDGEIQDETFQGIMNNARRKYDVQCDNALYKIWDIIPLKQFLNEECSVDLINRKQWLEHLLLHNDSNQLVFPNLVMLPYKLVDDFDGIVEEFEYWHILKGEEGVIVKDPTSMYQYSSGTKRGGKNAVWWKFKRQDFAEIMGDRSMSEYSVKIIGLYPGEKGTKYERTLGGFEYEFVFCTDTDLDIPLDEHNNIMVSGKCGSGLTDEQRDEFWSKKDELIGQIMDVESQEVTHNKNGQYSLRFPIFKRLRPDLNKVT